MIWKVFKECLSTFFNYIKKEVKHWKEKLIPIFDRLIDPIEKNNIANLILRIFYLMILILFLIPLNIILLQKIAFVFWSNANTIHYIAYPIIIDFIIFIIFDYLKNNSPLKLLNYVFRTNIFNNSNRLFIHIFFFVLIVIGIGNRWIRTAMYNIEPLQRCLCDVWILEIACSEKDSNCIKKKEACSISTSQQSCKPKLK